MNKSGLSGIMLAAALALLTMITATSTRSLAADCPGASVVRNAGADFMNAARQRSLGAFSSALARNADVRSASLFALGQYRKELPSARHQEYFRNAQSFMAQVLLKNSRSFRSSRELTIESCKGNIVETSLDGRSTMLWRLSGGRIKDVRVNGIWLTIQLRSKFTDVIRRNDGSVDALLDFLGRSGD